MKLYLELDMDNAEFECDPATAAGAIVIRLAEDWMALGFDNAGQSAEDGARGAILDTNGNTVGFWATTDKDQRPHRLDVLTEDELEALRTAVHNRLHNMHCAGRELASVSERIESRTLALLNREMNIEKGRRLGE